MHQVYAVCGRTAHFRIFFQFATGHSRGSSCGPSRATKRAYETLFYVKMMNDAHKLWKELEDECGVTMFK